MDGYGRKMLLLVFGAFCLMIPAVLTVNDSFNTLVQPPINAEVIQVEGLGSSNPNLTLVGWRLDFPELATFQQLKRSLIRNGKVARDKAEAWLAQVREGKWDSIASKKQEKSRN